jgi:hypothetical protein
MHVSVLCAALLFPGCGGGGSLPVSPVGNAPPPGSRPERQALDDAWWTGPLIAAGAATLPQGRVLVEPYVSHPDSFRSLTYLLYGVTDKLTAGLVPVFGTEDSLTLQAQYRLSQFREGSPIPTTSVVVQHSLPASTTTVALRSQYYLWMPNGRIMRTRFHVSYATADDVSGVITVNSSWEYSVTRNWVLALDFVHQRADFAVAPAIEYNWSGRVGVIVGARWFVAGSNSSATLTPIAAINALF